MLRIDLKSKPGEKKLIEVASIKSLNSNYRQKMLDEIHSNNRNISKRLKSTESVYSIDKWEESHKFREYVRDNISRNSGRVGKRRIIDAEKKNYVQGFQASMENSFEEFLSKGLDA